MAKELVYILGLSRVGSTMLDLVLGSHPRYIGLGEIYQVLRPDLDRIDHKINCSCGQVLDECRFWGETVDWLRRNRKLDLQKKYIHIIEVFNEVFGENSVLVDSSKLLDVMKVVAGLSQVNVKIIYMIRDVRAWTVSRLNHRKNAPGYYSSDGHYANKLAYRFGWKAKLFRPLIPHLTGLNTYYFWLWYLQNRKIDDYLQKNKIVHLQVGYDELGMYPDIMMPKIFQFLGTETEDMTYSSVHSQSHILVGNTRKTDTKRRQGIFYDSRWLYRNNWMIPAALFPNIMRYNAQKVYHSITTDSIWDK